MILNYLYENNNRIIDQTLKNEPSLSWAITSLDSLVASLRIQNSSRWQYEVPDQFVYPCVEILEHAYPICDCLVLPYSNQKRIRVSIGFLRFLNLFGAFEHAYYDLCKHAEEDRISFTVLTEYDVSRLADTLHNIYEYLKSATQQNVSSNSDNSSEINLKTLSPVVLYAAIRFPFGHEISHYLDNVADFNQQGQHQMELFHLSVELLVRAKDTPFEDRARQLLLDCSNDDFQYWSEEILADYQSYLYCTDTYEYSRLQQYLGMTIAFLAMQMLEYYELKNVQLADKATFYLPVDFRNFCLGYNVWHYNYKDEEWLDFLTGEWGIFDIFRTLYLRALETYERK